jgi:hypothetical protein
MKSPKAGVVVPAGPAPFSFYMADAFDTGDVGRAVPVASMTRADPTFDLDMMRALGDPYPDKEALAAICGRSVPAKNLWPVDSVMFGTNHKSGLRSWRFVTKANEEYKAQGQLFGHPISVSPPIFPAIYSPTGAVMKKLR